MDCNKSVQTHLIYFLHIYEQIQGRQWESQNKYINNIKDGLLPRVKKTNQKHASQENGIGKYGKNTSFKICMP